MKAIPMQKQLDFLSWEFGIFFHFGIRSFYPGHRDWDGIEMPAEGFDPDALDCEQWIRSAKEAGATYTILTTKHHDGFALWPSALSKYSVKDAAWKGGHGDVVREYVDACRKYGMKIGLYYSPAQWGSTALKFTDPREYDDYFIGQISELLGNYGKIDYLWFDGCGSEGHKYDKERIVEEIYRLQPDILVFGNPDYTVGTAWVGNEDGYASLDNRLAVSAVDFSELSAEKQQLAESVFLPTECDCKIRDTWFYDLNADTLKSADELFGMYEMSVGHGSNFLLNIGPDNHGRLCDDDLARLAELRDRIAAYKEPLPYTEIEQIGTDTYEIRPTGAPVLANRIVLSEDLTNGQSIRSFRLYANLPVYKKKRIQIYEGRTVGHKVICPFGALRASGYTLVVTDHDGDYRITDMKAYFAH